MTGVLDSPDWDEAVGQVYVGRAWGRIKAHRIT